MLSSLQYVGEMYLKLVQKGKEDLEMTDVLFLTFYIIASNCGNILDIYAESLSAFAAFTSVTSVLY